MIEGFPACNEGILPECPLDEYHQSQLHEKDMAEAWDEYTNKCLFSNTKEEEAVQAGFYRGWQAAMNKRLPSEKDVKKYATEIYGNNSATNEYQGWVAGVLWVINKMKS